MMNDRFEQVVDRFLDGYFRFNPTSATSLGFHQYDHLLEERTPEAVQGEMERLKDSQQLLQRQIDPVVLDIQDRVDVEILNSAITSELLELQEIRSWQRNPAYTSWLVSDSIYSLLIRDYAPLDDRLEAAWHRLEGIPSLLESARTNLRTGLQSEGGIPPIWVEIAQDEFRGAIEFFQTVVPAAAETSGNRLLVNRVLEGNHHVLVALEEMLNFLRSELSSQARGDYALGMDVFRQKLLLDEAVDTPVGEILARGEDELRRTQAEMTILARRIDQDRSLPEIIERLSSVHPSGEDLVESYHRRLASARRFVEANRLVTIPEGALEVVETPSFLRSLLFAALDPPGPFEQVSLPTFFYVTPTEPAWTAAEKEEYLRQHNDYSQMVTIFHEAFPGHYVQCAHCHRTRSRIRRVFMSGAFVEGWAHYCEQLLIDEGFGRDDPELQLFQLHESLWRIGRLIVATRMHTEGLGFDEAVAFFMRECYQERANALREVKRFTTDPLVLIYTWGKWQIQDLREEIRVRQGPAFSLNDFHDRILGEGEPPVTMLRRLLLDTQGGGHDNGSRSKPGYVFD